MIDATTVEARTSRSILSATLVQALLFWIASGASAAIFTVTNLADSGPGSLRQAVLDANAAAGADDVAFAPGLTGTITLISGQITISDPLIVNGPGLGVLTVSGNHNTRILLIENPSSSVPIDVTLSGLTFTEGAGLPTPPLGDEAGGAIYSRGENLTILRSVVSNSTVGTPGSFGTACGGNVALADVTGLLPTLTLRIFDSLLTGGAVVGGGAGAGGGNLCVRLGTLLLEESTLSAGSAEKAIGGGLFLATGSSGNSIVRTTFTGNFGTSQGAGIEVFLSVDGVLTIESSTISNNSSFNGGGGLALFGGRVRILDSTISDNQAGFGGGLLTQGSAVELTNCTVSQNLADFAAGISHTNNEEGSLLLRLTTVSGNRAITSGGGVVVSSLAPVNAVHLDHSILANSIPDDLAGDTVSATAFANYTLIETPGASILAGANNLIGIDPQLGPLADNGGPTLTHKPSTGSPVIGAGDPAIPSPPPTDQRGSARIVGAAIDLGSVEGGTELVEVPALSEVGLVVLSLWVLAAGVVRMRRPRATPKESGRET